MGPEHQSKDSPFTDSITTACNIKYYFVLSEISLPDRLIFAVYRAIFVVPVKRGKGKIFRPHLGAGTPSLHEKNKILL
jgi:hypothetical protein